MKTFKEYITESTKTLGKLINIKFMNADGDEMVYLTLEDYSEDKPIEFDLELSDLHVKKLGKLAYDFYNDIGDLQYPLDVTKDQEKEIKKNLIKANIK